MIRLLSFSIVSALVFIGIAPGLGVGIASAESGNISVSYDATKTYTQGAAGNPSTTLFTKIFWDSADYNKINDFKVSVNTPFSYTFAHDFESTAFTITSGGSGGGMAWYDKNSSKLYWVFYGSDTFTSSPLTLIYSTNIWVNVTNDADYTFSWTLDANNPLSVGATDGNNGQIRRTYIASMSAATTDHYVISYPGSGLFTAAITKGVLQTKHYIHSQTIEYTHEATFNTAPYQFTGNYNDGLYINVTLSNGAYTNVLVNSTSSGMPAPAPTPVINPDTHGGLLWNKNNYTKMETGTLSYQYDSGLFESWFSHWVDIKNVNDGNSIQKFDGLGTSGTISYQFPNTGSYQAQYFKCLFLTCLLPSLLDTATVQVSSGQQTQLFANQTYYVGIASNISYYLNPFYITDFNFYYWSIESNKYILSYGSYGTPTGYGNKSFKCGLITKYKITLDTATTYVDCKNDNTHAQYNITSSYLNLSSATPTLTDYLDVDYGVASASWINNVTDIVVYDNKNIETFRLPLSYQKKIIPFFLVQSPHEWNDMVVSIGLNTIKLETEKGIVLATNTFTVSATTAEGYGLIFDKTTFCINEKMIFTYYAPSDVNITVWDSNDALVAKGFLNASVTGKKSSIIYSNPGTYNIRLTWNGVQYINQILTINSCVAPSPTTTGDRTTTAMSSPWLWVALIVGGLFLVGMTEAGLAGGIVGSTIGMIISYGFNYVPLWALMLFAFAIILSLALFVGGKVTGKGGSNGD